MSMLPIEHLTLAMEDRACEVARVSRGSENMTIRFGGQPRAELLEMLSEAGVRLNAHAETLLFDPMFDHPAEHIIDVAIRSVLELGLPDGGTLSQVFEAGRSNGLDVVPLVAGPYVRLAFTQQAQAPDSVLSGGRAPSGSIHIASRPPREDVEYPKGFYLRVVDGESWLRGYRCDGDYVFEPEQRFLFACA